MHRSRKIQVVTFDLDGTVIDDEWAHEQAKTEIAQSIGVTGDLDLQHFLGRSNRLFWENVCRLGNVSEDIEHLTQLQFHRVLELVRQAAQPESPGLTDTLRYLKREGYTVALTSGSDAFFVDEMIKHLNIVGFVDIKVTKDYVRQVKPSPDIYLAAQRLANVEPAAAIGVEDSDSGCQALCNAGMISVGYTNRGKNPQAMAGADYRIGEMTQLIPLLEALNGQGKGSIMLGCQHLK